ncbi:hypothetical protein SFRURICE_019695 [Spodoptera frugiperda]|nr:hypothetical protein SFRURICE_019695 [Spodoptera frugiperda]
MNMICGSETQSQQRSITYLWWKSPLTLTKNFSTVENNLICILPKFVLLLRNFRIRPSNTLPEPRIELETSFPVVAQTASITIIEQTNLIAASLVYRQGISGSIPGSRKVLLGFLSGFRKFLSYSTDSGISGIVPNFLRGDICSMFSITLGEARGRISSNNNRHAFYALKTRQMYTLRHVMPLFNVYPPFTYTYCLILSTIPDSVPSLRNCLVILCRTRNRSREPFSGSHTYDHSTNEPGRHHCVCLLCLPLAIPISNEPLTLPSNTFELTHGFTSMYTKPVYHGLALYDLSAHSTWSTNTEAALILNDKILEFRILTRSSTESGHGTYNTNGGKSVYIVNWHYVP